MNDIMRFWDTITGKRRSVSRDTPLPTSVIGSNVGDYGPVTPNDSTELSDVIGIMVTGNAGNVSVMKPNGQTVVIPASALPVGVIQPLPLRRVRSSGTTATGVWVVRRWLG